MFVSDEAFFGSIDHFVVDFVIFEEGCKRLMPSQVGAAESKEYLKGTKVLQFGDQLIFLFLPKPWCARQGGITCGAIDDPRKSSKAIDERVIINFRDKNVVIARFRDKNVYR